MMMLKTQEMVLKPRWMEEALMTHSVVIHAMMMSWVPRRRSGKPTCDILMYQAHRGPRAWLRLLKKHMMPLAWWRSLWNLEGMVKAMWVIYMMWHEDALAFGNITLEDVLQALEEGWWWCMVSPVVKWHDESWFAYHLHHTLWMIP